MEKQIEQYIKQGLQVEIANKFDEIKTEMLRKLDYEKDKICAGILLNVMKLTEFQTMNDRVVFSIRKIEKSND